MEYEQLSGERELLDKHEHPIHDGVIILDSDVDEPEYPQKAVDAVSKKDVGATFEECVGGAASGEDVEAGSKVNADAAFKEDVKAVHKGNVDAASEEDVEEVPKENIDAVSKEDVEATSGEGSSEGAIDPGVDDTSLMFSSLLFHTAGART